jgi:hypothetical protein
MFKVSNSLPVLFAAIVGVLVPVMRPDDSAVKKNPFDSVEVIQPIESNAADEAPSVRDVLLQETYDRTEELGKVASSLVRSTEMANSRVATLVAKVSEIEAKQAETMETVKQATGPGFKIPELTNSECDCDCLTEDEIRKIVSDEFNNQKLAEAVSPRNYASTATYNAPTVTYYQAPAVTYQQRTSRFGQPVRTILRGTSCVVDAFGNKICPSR